MKLTTKELKQIFKKLAKYLEQLNRTVIYFENEDNLYFKVWHRNRDRFLEILHASARGDEQLPYTIGDLSDEIEFLKKLLTEKEWRVANSIDLQHFGALLTA